MRKCPFLFFGLGGGSRVRHFAILSSRVTHELAIICQKNRSISALSWEFNKQNQKKYANFSGKSGKLSIQIEDHCYKNWRNAQIRKINWKNAQTGKFFA